MQWSICCSSRAAKLTARWAERLERNLGIRTLLVEEDSVPVTETWEEGTASAAMLILLDRVSAPPPLQREAWTGLLEHDGAPPIAFARLEECAYPKLLERRTFFPAGDELALERTIERWLAAKLPAQAGIAAAACPGEVPAEWWAELVDKPGQATTASASAAQSFAHQAAPHFRGIVWIGCQDREPALIRAELEHRLGSGRMLVVLAHIDKPLTIPPDRHSYIQIVGAPAEADGDAALGACYAPGFPGWFAKELGADLSGDAVLLDAAAGTYRLACAPRADERTRLRHLELVHRYFRAWKSKPEPCRALLGEVPAAIYHGFTAEWAKAAELCGWAAFLLLADGRRREGIRLWHRLLVEAEEEGEEEVAANARHELSWLTDEDGPVRTPILSATQLTLEL